MKMFWKELWKELSFFGKNRKYVFLLTLTAVCSFGMLILHPAIGIDDTAIERYLVDGLEPSMGRWCLFLIQKVFHIAEYAPFMTEVAGILILAVSATLWCVVFRRILGDKVGEWGYTIFACVFLSSPILSEIYTYYLHNGISLAYGVTALASMVLLRGMEKKYPHRVRALVVSGLLLTTAVGFYESMLMVYVIAAMMLLMLICVTGQKEKYQAGVLRWAGAGIMVLLGTLILRGLLISGFTALFRLQDQKDVLATRSMSEALQWFDGSRSLSDLAMVFKRFFVMYYVNAICYFPVTVFVLAAAVMVAWGIYRTVRCRDGRILLCAIGILAAPWMMLLVEGYATHYRASQYVPLVCAFAVLLIAFEIKGIRREKLRRIFGAAGAAAAAVLIFNQATEMNKWFYVDYLKYEDAKNTMNTIAYELEAHYDTSKPVIVRGSYEVPYGIVKDAYLPFSSRKYQLIARILDAIDPHLKEKYYSEHGYFFSETPLISVVDWGVNAFDDTNVEFFRFWEMHGHTFVLETDLDKYEEAQQKLKELSIPSWPQEGFIRELDDYIIVNLE